MNDTEKLELALETYVGPYGPLMWMYLQQMLNRPLTDTEKQLVKRMLGHR